MVPVGLDDQEIEVAGRSLLAAGGGAKEDDPLRRGDADDTADDLSKRVATAFPRSVLPSCAPGCRAPLASLSLVRLSADHTK
jgi:hypothetical protein